MLEEIDIVASLKFDEDSDKGAYSSTILRTAQIEARGITSLKEISSISPNFHQPDYGSKMTSSIYARGFGSRIDQPVVALNVDGVPVMNKNNYDFDFFDIQRIQVLRGAQSTLYGRNTTGGAINITTLSPLNFQGKRISIGGGSYGSFDVKASHYAAPSRRFGWSSSIYYSRNDGYFTNRYNNKKCDGGDNIALRLRAQYLPTDEWSIDNTLSAGYVDEGGYAYRSFNPETGVLFPVNYNDNCSYRRLNISDALVVKRYFAAFTLSSSTGISYTHDRMRLDNDFTSLDYFTLGQYQKELSLSQEFVAKSKGDTPLQWIAGIFGFYKHQRLDAPVNFKQDGIEELIVKNANDNFFHIAGGDYSLDIREDDFTIEDKFTIPTLGAALYGQLNYSIGNFDFAAGLRLDYEHSAMDYNSHTTLHYKIMRSASDYTPLTSTFKGNSNLDSWEVLPRLTAAYNHKRGDVYLSVCKGFKAGGFNTQLFSDILREKLTDDIIGNSNNDDASATVYRPEESWNYEVGAHLSLLPDDALTLSGALFYIDCRNQQLTVFPKGNSTGRMMSNAGRSHSYGGEVSLSYVTHRLTANMAFGYTHAIFKEYRSGDMDYSGNFLPLAPRETFSANITYSVPVSQRFANSLVLNLGYTGTGRIYWNEENTLSQGYYEQLSASVTWRRGIYGVQLWGKNLMGTNFYTFYFKSVGNDFFAQGKPFRVGATFSIIL